MNRPSAVGSLLFLFGGSVLCAGAVEKYTYWIAPCEDTCQAGDPQLAEWAFGAWQTAASGTIQFTIVEHPEHARIRLYWGSPEQGLYGEARPIVVDGKKGAEVYVRPAPLATPAPQANDDTLLRDAVVYLTCLHETGHALGLAHTATFDDIMYSFQYGGDIPEYFARYRRKLRTRADIRKNSGLSDADRSHLLEAVKERK